MKIAIDLTPLYNRKITGIEVYGIELYYALLKTGNDIYPIFRVKNTLDDNPNSIIINSPNRFVVENFFLSMKIRKIKADYIFFPIFPPPMDIYILKNGYKIIPTIHDLTFKLFPSTLSFGAKFYLKPKYKLAMKYSDKLITISETVKNELKNCSKIQVLNLGESISSIYQEVDKYLDISLVEKWGVKAGEYFISVSTLEPRKNFKYLLQIFKEIQKKDKNRKLVLVGRKGWGKDYELESIIHDLGDALIFTDYVSNIQLINLYHFSSAFFLLSIYEGFGRTPLEAIACGCKNVFVSDIPIFRETLSNKVTYLPLDSITRSVELIENIDLNEKSSIDIELPFNVLEINVISEVSNL